MVLFKVTGIDWDCFAPPEHYNMPYNTTVEAYDPDDAINKLSEVYGWNINSVESIVEC